MWIRRDPVTVVGAGGHGRVILALLKESGIPVRALLDDDERLHGQQIGGVRVAGGLDLLPQGESAVLAIGNNKIRQTVAESRPDADWRVLVHPSAVVAGSVTIAAGSVVMAGAVLQDGTEVGEHAIVNSGAVVDHDGTIGAFAHMAPNATITGGCELEEGALLGAGATLHGPSRLGAWSVAGAGSVVIRDVAADTVVAGVPAKPIDV